MLRPTFSPTIHMPMRMPVLASPAARSAPASMKYSSCPRLQTNIVRRYGSAAARTSGEAWTSVSSEGEMTYPMGARTPSASTTAVRNAW